MLSILAGTCLASFLIALALPAGVDFVFSLGPIIEVVVVMEIDGGGHVMAMGKVPSAAPPPRPAPAPALRPTLALESVITVSPLPDLQRG